MIEKAVFISRIAGNIIREGFGKNLQIEFKTNKANIVTDIDKKSENIIKNFIRKEFPTHGILAEESGHEKGSSEFIWVIDPLDGTTNFAHGLPIFSVSIGVIKGKEIICGVVYDVMRDEVYSAEKGSGSHLNSKRIKVSSTSQIEESLLVTGFPYNISENPDNAIEKFSTIIKKARGVRRLGSAAIDFCYVASGVFEGFWEVDLNPWDACAGKLLVEEAGGKVTNFAGENIDIYSRQFLAGNGKINSILENILGK